MLALVLFQQGWQQLSMGGEIMCLWQTVSKLWAFKVGQFREGSFFGETAAYSAMAKKKDIFFEEKVNFTHWLELEKTKA